MQLADLEGEKHFATVQIGSNTAAPAEFRLDGSESYLQVYVGEPLTDWQPPQFLLSTMPDGTHLTFCDCVTRTTGTFGSSEGTRHYVKLQPHWVSIGCRHLTEDTRICSIIVLVDDASAIFYDFDAFGYATSPEKHIDGILATESKQLGRTITRGDLPIIGYFTGCQTVCSTNTTLGRVSAFHSLTQSMNGPNGIRLTSRVFIELQPYSAVTLAEAMNAFMSVLRFLEMIAGRPQNVLAVKVAVPVESAIPQYLEVYWPLRPRRRADGELPHPADMPLNGGVDPETFGELMARWLSTDATRREARTRYASVTTSQNIYGVDRLVGAANMFDVLPLDALPAANELPPELIRARDTARELFISLPRSPERDSILSALGRLDRSNLKRKVRHRASLISRAATPIFPQLDVVVDEAINCRNRYVHGSATRIDYAGNERHLTPFLTDTLEFVFGASELIEAGWDIMEWVGRGTTMSHPWGAYRVGYKQNLTKLKELLAEGSRNE